MKKKIIFSSIMSIMLCLSLIAGSTFALFTSEKTVNVAVTAGNVDVTATVEDVLLSSTLGENVAETGYSFENNVLALEKFIPGDVLNFSIRITNNSDITVSYRTVIAMVEDSGLWDGLEVVIDGKSYDGATLRAPWAKLLPGSEDIILPVSISLPETAGNEYEAKGCKLAYTVEAIQGNVDTATIPDDGEQLDGLLQGGGDATLNDDLTLNTNDTAANSGYGKTGVKVDGGVFDGQGHTFTVENANSTWDCAIAVTAGTIKNLTVSGAMRGIFMPAAIGDVVIDNVVFDDVIYTFNSDAGSKAYSVTVKNSVLNGWTSFSDAHKSVDFINCTFGEGSGYAFCRPYNDATFTNCVFEEGFEFDTSRADKIVFINCYYGDTLITNENAASLGNGETTLFYNGLGGLKIPYEVSDANALAGALLGGDLVTLENDLAVEAATTAPYGNKVGFIQNGGVLDGNGNTLSVECYGDDYGIMTSGGTIKNLTIDSGCRAIMIMSPTEDVILENVYVVGDILYPINTGEAGAADVDLIVTGSTFGGWSSFANIASARFTDCAFVAGNYGYGWPYDCLVKPYVNTVFTDCTFDAEGGYYLDLSALGADCTVTLTGCTVGGTVITAENCTALFGEIELPTGRTIADCLIFN